MNTAQLYTWLSAEAAVTALIGSPPRIYPGVAPDGSSGSWATYTGISGLPINHFGGFAGVDFVRVQIDCYADTKAAADALADTIATALDARGYVVGWNPEGRDAETRKWSKSFDFEFFGTR